MQPTRKLERTRMTGRQTRSQYGREDGGVDIEWVLVVDNFRCRRCVRRTMDVFLCVCALTGARWATRPGTLWTGGEGGLRRMVRAPPPHDDDDELLFKSRVLLLFKIPIPKLLHAPRVRVVHKEKGRSR